MVGLFPFGLLVPYTGDYTKIHTSFDSNKCRSHQTLDYLNTCRLFRTSGVDLFEGFFSFSWIMEVALDLTLLKEKLPGRLRTFTDYARFKKS